jgi:hypothetical protein
MYDFLDLFMLWIFCPYVRFGDVICGCMMILWHVYFDDVWFISAATVKDFYICMLFEFLMWRSSVYFLNICIIRVYYCFNRNRALQVGIRAVVGLVRTSIHWISCCIRMVLSYLQYLLCCSVLLGRFERSEGVAGCF